MKESQPKKYRYVSRKEASVLAELGLTIFAEHPVYGLYAVHSCEPAWMTNDPDGWEYSIEEE